MPQLDNLNAISSECDRIVDGMLNGSMTRDDGLFAAAMTLRNIAHEFHQFVSYALPVIHAIDQALRTAAQAPPQPQVPAAPASAAHAPAAQAQAPANGAPINGGAGTNNEIQVVAGAPAATRQ